jgi:hypothetical protein
MVIQDVLYVALSTVLVMVILQLATFMVTRMLYPPEPRIVYRDVPIVQQPQYVPQVQEQAHVAALPPLAVFTQPKEEVQLPEYEPRKPASTSLRMDTELPAGIQETRPQGA